MFQGFLFSEPLAPDQFIAIALDPDGAGRSRRPGAEPGRWKEDVGMISMRSTRSGPSRSVAAAVLGARACRLRDRSGGGTARPSGAAPAQSGQWRGAGPRRDRRSQPRRCHGRAPGIDGGAAPPARRRRRPRSCSRRSTPIRGRCSAAKATATRCGRRNPVDAGRSGRSAIRCCSMRWRATTISRCRPRSRPARPSRSPAAARRRRRRRVPPRPDRARRRRRPAPAPPQAPRARAAARPRPAAIRPRRRGCAARAWRR